MVGWACLCTPDRILELIQDLVIIITVHSFSLWHNHKQLREAQQNIIPPLPGSRVSSSSGQPNKPSFRYRGATDPAEVAPNGSGLSCYNLHCSCEAKKP